MEKSIPAIRPMRVYCRKESLKTPEPIKTPLKARSFCVSITLAALHMAEMIGQISSDFAAETGQAKKVSLACPAADPKPIGREEAPNRHSPTIM
ncbi:hypothetical protein ACJ72_01577 [Emergomyces africanus]|uniref:Uncharacterized protein n=1 Tax=Emergomyces africanus TaxID=1955775 RepID=A0A1B7P4S7_9EURO|nr:hypothetical protein ACJ72_01577 [Emergomyces africanus]